MRSGSLSINHFLISSFISLCSATAAYAVAMPAGLVFGPNPIYTPAVKPNMIVDEFGVIDETLSAEKLAQIKNQIADWKSDGISYGAYLDLSRMEGELRYTLVDAARIELDGTAVTGVDNAGKTFYQVSASRSAYTDYLINSAKLAIDAGAGYIFLDVAGIELHFLSYDDEAIAGFAASQNDPNLNIRAYLAGLGYADINALRAAEPSLQSDVTWNQWVAYGREYERQWFQTWSSTLKAYAANLGQTVMLSGNRTIDTDDVWDQLDVLDYPMAETFLDSLGYPYVNLNFIYKAATAFGTRLWSWNFPANTSTLNGTGDPFATADQVLLDQLFVAETFANGGISQVGGAGWVNYHYKGFKGDKTAPYYRFVQMHPELFGHKELGEIAVLFSEAGTSADFGGMGKSYRGATLLLGDDHRPWDAVFAANAANRDGSEVMNAAKLNQYKAVVLPLTKQLSDAQITLLETYIGAGGSVIGFSSVATQDTNGSDVSAARSFDDLFGSDAVDTSTYPGGKVISFAADLGSNEYAGAAVPATRAAQVASFNSVVDAQITRDIVTDLPATVKITRYEDISDGSQIIHLINNDWDSVNNVITASTAGANFTFKAPVNFSGTPTVSILSPETPTAISLTVTDNTNGTYTITLPSLGVWNILKIGSAAAAAGTLDDRPLSQMHFVDNQFTSLDDTTATGGNRADVKDANGNIEFNYWYWKGGDAPIPWDVMYLASDDKGLSGIDLYYRYSTDASTWGNWTVYLNESVAGTDFVAGFSFTPPDGDGHYQFYTQATDSAGQSEMLVASDKNGFGVDTTPPGAPADFAATGLVEGEWQLSSAAPVFTWSNPSDDGSGLKEAWLELKNNIGTPIAAIYNLDAGTTTWDTANSNNNGIDIGALTEGERYSLYYRGGDASANKSIDYMVYTFSYGTSPLLGKPFNITATVGNAEMTVSWDNPVNTTDFGYSRVYVRRANSGDVWQNPRQTADATVSSSLMDGLINDVEYEVAVEAVSSGTDKSGDMIFAECTYTPTAAGGTSTCPPSYTISIAESNGGSDVSEDGASDTYTLVLNAQPASDVTVQLTVDNQLTTDVSSLVFTSANWNLAQTITLNAVDDNRAEGAHSATVSHTVSSTDVNYDAVTLASINVSITDNDIAGISLSETNASTAVTEGGASDSYGLVLDTQPANDVVIQLSTDAQLSATPNSLTFTAANWNLAQTVTVDAIDDMVVEGDHTSSISHGISSNDMAYDVISVSDVSVTISDNDVAAPLIPAGIILTESDDSTDIVEGGASDTYTLVLNSQPASDVTIFIASDFQFTTSSASIVFTPSNWDSVQTVTVSAVDDSDVENLHTGRINHSVSSDDNRYNGLDVTDINISITDNDVADNSGGATSTGGNTSSGGGAVNPLLLFGFFIMVCLNRRRRN